ncbi:conserved hypothetical protein [Candidatus Protochlamydia naegleriophila]|uniref:YacP-like NYN domain protein n=1 Tax=Candidatus Protochlamydia naegleriophila TaxID=389348 RepID=A0A0U5JBH1_9BACT|nr:NYN domain-containing protein [Candidatus Protochlamydia naegleriophila]CUI15711.1 conserved hypothetical protein [Candidatus Protochlamydia naegleriophila]
MHYYIDGYNLLFRLMHAHDHLQTSREQIILDLNKKASLVRIDVSIVFDGTFQVGEGTRTHFDHIEISFTAEGETADEFILDELKNSRHPEQETVVTSDKKLAWQARCRQAHTESVEDFMAWLNKSYKNKLKQLKNPPTRRIAPKLVTPLTPAEPLIEATVESSHDYYARIFEAHYLELVKNEKPRKPKAETKPPSPKKQKRKKDPFQSEPILPLDAPSQTERWQKAFEERLKHSSDHPL